MTELRKQILLYLEKNSRADLEELAVPMHILRGFERGGRKAGTFYRQAQE